MDREGKMICWTRPQGGQGQVRKRVHMCRSWLRVKSTPGARPASPFPTCPTSSLPNTQGSQNSKSSVSKKREPWRRCATLRPLPPPPQTHTH